MSLDRELRGQRSNLYATIISILLGILLLIARPEHRYKLQPNQPRLLGLRGKDDRLCSRNILLGGMARLGVQHHHLLYSVVQHYFWLEIVKGWSKECRCSASRNESSNYDRRSQTKFYRINFWLWEWRESIGWSWQLRRQKIKNVFADIYLFR